MKMCQFGRNVRRFCLGSLQYCSRIIFCGRARESCFYIFLCRVATFELRKTGGRKFHCALNPLGGNTRDITWYTRDITDPRPFGKCYHFAIRHPRLNLEQQDCYAHQKQYSHYMNARDSTVSASSCRNHIGKSEDLVSKVGLASRRRVRKVTFLRFKADVNLQVIHVVRQRPDTCRNHTTLNFVPRGLDPFVQRRGPQASVTPPVVR